MKPTQEQVIAWAREVGLKVDWQHADIADIKTKRLEDFATFAYEAGRKDENEACAELIPPQYFELRDRIRARNEQ